MKELASTDTNSYLVAIVLIDFTIENWRAAMTRTKIALLSINILVKKNWQCLLGCWKKRTNVQVKYRTKESLESREGPMILHRLSKGSLVKVKEF